MALYESLHFPDPGMERPYCFINMVATIDGKILIGSRDEHVLDLGSKTDHVLMKRIEAQADGLLVGAQTVRVAPRRWSPLPKIKVVVTSSGNLPYENSFFDGDSAYVATHETSRIEATDRTQILRAGHGTLDLKRLLHDLRHALGVRHLLVLGGSELNAQLLALDLIDELFITIAPKVKLGRDVPTYADGDPLGRESLLQYSLVENHAVGDEVFIRYRREARSAATPATPA